MSKEIFRLEDIGFKMNNQQILENNRLTGHKRDNRHVTGPTGGRKSTLLKLMGSLISPTSGKIYYKEKEVSTYEPTEYRKQVSYFFQNAVLFDQTVRQILSFQADIRFEYFEDEIT